MILGDIDYKRIFYYFEKISEVPRGSGHNEKISNFLVHFAKERNLHYIQDDAWNVTVFKKGTDGYEDMPPVILQGHMDMVCEKEWGVEHDFERDGIRLRIEDGFIKADGTTLGADNGIAMAYMLAILDGKDFRHPPLEAVFTSDEEIGLLGASYLDTTPLKGKYLVNLDSEEEGFLLASCAGGVTAKCRYPLQRERKSGECLNISISGLLGGHSGMEIDKNRTNAILLMGRLLLELGEVGYHLVSIKGGSKDNAIPREAECRLLIEGDVREIIHRIQDVAESMKDELSGNEPNMQIDCENTGQGEAWVIKRESVQGVLSHLLSMANGVQTMSSHVKGLVESSLNLGILEMNEASVCFSHSIRSSVGTYKSYMCNRMKYLVTRMGGTYEEQGGYPEWEYREQSRLRDMACRVYESINGKELKVEAVHAGLECGALAKKLPDVDMISMGPNLFDVHTPKERLDIDSAIRTFDFLVKILEEFGK